MPHVGLTTNLGAWAGQVLIFSFRPKQRKTIVWHWLDIQSIFLEQTHFLQGFKKTATWNLLYLFVLQRTLSLARFFPTPVNSLRYLCGKASWSPSESWGKQKAGLLLLIREGVVCFTFRTFWKIVAPFPQLSPQLRAFCLPWGWQWEIPAGPRDGGSGGQKNTWARNEPLCGLRAVRSFHCHSNLNQRSTQIL